MDKPKRLKGQITPGLKAPRPEDSDPDKPLTERQRLFVHHLVHNRFTQTAAARQAGIKGAGNAAHRMMRDPKILAAIAEAKAEYAAATGLTRKKVIDGFLEAIDMARMKADPIAMIGGWREVGRMCGFYEPTKTKVEVSVNGQVMVQRLNSMSDEELLALAENDPNVIDGGITLVED